MEKNTLKLTPEQAKLIKELLGEDVDALNIRIEEFDVQGTEGGRMRVLKVDNVAVVRGGAVGRGGTVN